MRQGCGGMKWSEAGVWWDEVGWWGVVFFSGICNSKGYYEGVPYNEQIHKQRRH